MEKYTQMDRSEKIRRIYTIFLAVFVLACGIAVICVTADIYYSGKDGGVIYSSQIVAERLERVAIPLLFLIAAVIVGAIFPLCSNKVKPKSEDILKKLRQRMPSGGDGEEFEMAQAEYKKYAAIRLTVWLLALAVTLAGAIYSVCYLADGRHFAGADITREILLLVRHVLSFTLASLAALAIASVLGGVFAKKQLNALKDLIKYGDGSTDGFKQPELINKARTVAGSNIALIATRSIVFVIAVAFIIVGVLNGGARDVLVKAINICQECIGLG